MNKKVSVNITAHNRAHLLPRCLKSVIKQTYSDLEIVVVDDCSSDATQEVVAEYQKLDGRIKYFRHEINKGNAFARNTALENCTGSYVAFMDDDDEWIDIHKLEKQINVFESNIDSNLGIVCTGVRIFDNENSFRDVIHHKPSNLSYKILIGNSIIYNSTVLTKRDIMLEVGGFDTEFPVGIDADFFRSCIVKYSYDVYFMEDITTGVHEYGPRMTPIKSLNSLKKNIRSIELRLSKYEDFFELDQKAKLYRKKDLIKKYIKLVLREPNWHNFKNIFKGMFL